MDLIKGIVDKPAASASHLPLNCCCAFLRSTLCTLTFLVALYILPSVVLCTTS